MLPVFATALVLTLAPSTQSSPLAQVVPAAPQPTHAGPTFTFQHEEDKTVVNPDAPRRSKAWVLAGAYGMASLGAGIGGVMEEAFTRSTSEIGDAKDTKAGNRGMVLGLLIGLIPGLIFGNEARREENSLGRGMTLMLDVGGTLAVGFSINQIYSTKGL